MGHCLETISDCDDGLTILATFPLPSELLVIPDRLYMSEFLLTQADFCEKIAPRPTFKA